MILLAAFKVMPLLNSCFLAANVTIETFYFYKKREAAFPEKTV